MTEYSPAKTGEYPRIFPNFENRAHCEKDFKDNKDNSPYLGRKYARIFVLGHYLFLVAHGFPHFVNNVICRMLCLHVHLTYKLRCRSLSERIILLKSLPNEQSVCSFSRYNKLSHVRDETTTNSEKNHGN